MLGETKILEEIEKGTLKTPSNVTIREYLEYRLSKQRSKVGDTTYETYERFAGKICDFMGDMEFKEITQYTGKNIIEDLQNYLENRANAHGGGIAKNTIKNIETYFKKILQHAEDEGKITKNPYNYVSFERVKAPKAKDSVKLYEQSEQRKILDYTKIYSDKRDDQRWYIFTYLDMAHGLRLGELTGLKEKDIDYTNRTLSIERTIIWTKKNPLGKEKEKPKTESGIRKIQLTDYCVAQLKAYKSWKIDWLKQYNRLLNADDWFICYDDFGIIHRRATQARIAEIEKGANVNHIKERLIHGFRHSNVTNLVNSNMAINKVSSMAGHSDPNVTLQTYTHNYKKEDNRAEIEVANKHLIS